MGWFGGGSSDLQKSILRTYDRNPDMTAKQIASKCDCSASYVRQTIKEHRPDLFDDGVLDLDF